MPGKNIIRCAAVTIVILFSTTLFAQDTADQTSQPQSATTTSIVTDSNWPTIPTLAMFVAVPTITLIYGMETWDWGEQNEWRWAHEGFFGQNTDSGGADKIGHGWAHYLAFRVFHNYYDWSEKGKSTKWIYSISTATFLGVFIEVGDAFTGKYGFSYEDVVADMAGIGLGILLEYSPTLDSLIGFSWQYWPTESYFDRWGKNPLHMTSDYSGAKYVFNFRLAGLQNLGIKIPTFMRYIQFDIGYFTRNYVRWDNTTAEPYRSMYYGISLNFMEVVKDFFENPESKPSKILQQPFKYYHIPAGYFVEDKI